MKMIRRPEPNVELIELVAAARQYFDYADLLRQKTGRGYRYEECGQGAAAGPDAVGQRRKVMAKYNATATFILVPWPVQVRHGTTPKILTMRARVTPKRVIVTTRTFDRMGKRISAYHSGQHAWRMQTVVMDDGTCVFPLPGDTLTDSIPERDGVTT